MITGEGEPGVGFFVIVEGSAKVSVGGERRALSVPATRSARWRSSTRDRARRPSSPRPTSAAWRSPPWDFKPFVEEHPTVAWALLEALAAASRSRVEVYSGAESRRRSARRRETPAAKRSTANGVRSNGVGRPSASERDVLADDRALLEAVAREAGGVDEPRRLERLPTIALWSGLIS